ncbi:MAG: hypothetical protein QF635_00945 [Candidatus Thalassarchaeaceae archaeon]|jgi:hypothetical protein|nr:hypothetical protein [Candidatus Thalassarchaeaceae archaeon]MDP7659162.1 hypothetical protein [Candidatus Thalassarchaeaceae archaeon]|tara:strand:+ start:299 stop:925 length:627 start_codon:yes stop_codon:yes gene_type:complete
MDIEMDTMKREVGGAFVVAWLVVGMGWGSLEAALIMAAAWMAFSGAHILPVVTWMHMMTGDLSDAEGNWMANGMRLVAQIVGAVLAIALATEVGAVETSWDLVQPGFDTPGTWEAIGMVAAGAIFWMVHTRADSAWVSAFAVMVLAGTMGMTYEAGDAVVSTTGAGEMASSIMSSGEDIVNIATAWIVSGVLCGLGALLATKMDELIE